jgi:Trk K+ transport system NAD-binding subunit
VRSLREALRHRPRTLTFTVEPGTIAAHLAGRPLRDVDLPEHCLVTLVHRGGETLVPDGATRLAEGDEVTLLAATDVLADAADRIGLQAPR